MRRRSLANALSGEFADLSSREYAISGWSVPEIVSVVLDSGWAWAGLAICAGWLLTRTSGSLVHGAVVGPVALLAAVAAYAFVDTARSGAPLSDWIHSEPYVWWIAAVVFGVPLGSWAPASTCRGWSGCWPG